MLDSRLDSQLPSLEGGEVSEIARHLDFLLQVGGLDHQRVRLPADRQQIIRTPGIAHVHKTGPLPLWAQHLVRSNRAPIGQSGILPIHQVPPPGPRRDIQGFGFLRQKGSARFLLE